MAKKTEVNHGYSGQIKLPEGMSTNALIFVDRIQGHGGRLPSDIRAHACWYYCICATKHMVSVDSGGVYEGDKDRDVMLSNIANAVGLQYNVDPAEFLKFIGFCRNEVKAEGGTWDARIENPGGHKFLHITN